MTAPLREQTATLISTTLDGGINASVTSIDVLDGSNFPVTGNFRIRVDDEIIIVTARSSNTLTVVRGQEGTTGATHSNGATVSLVATNGGLIQSMVDSWPMFGYSDPLHRLVADDGLTILTNSDFTKINQEGAIFTDQDGTILLRADPAGGTDLRIAHRTAPSTPYSYVAAFQCCMPLDNGDDAMHFGIGFRESSTSKLSTIMYVCQGHTGSTVSSNSLQVRHWEDENGTTFATVRTERQIATVFPVVWFKIEDDGTDHKFYIGMDSVNWIEIFSESRTTYLAGGPDQVFWYGQNSATVNDALIRLLHWSRV